MLASVFFTASSNVNIVNNKVTCSYSGVYVRSGSSLVTVSNNYINNSYGSTTDAALRHGPSIIVGADNSTIENNRVIGVLSTAVADSDIATGIYAGTDGPTVYNNIVITGNTVQNTYSAIAVSLVTNITINGNSLQDCKTSNHSQAIICTSVNNGVITGNSCYNIDYTAIALVDCKFFTISGNSISNSSSFAIGSTATANGMTISQTANGLSANHNVTGNTIAVNGATAGIGYYGILLYGDNSVITNNILDIDAAAFAIGIQFTGTGFNVNGNRIKAAYDGMRVIDVATWTTTANNVIATNNIEVAGANARYPVLDSSTGPNRYIENSYFGGIPSFTNVHFYSNDNGYTFVSNKTADYTVTTNDTKKQFSNSGATGTITFSLPSATGSASNFPYGLVYRFYNIVGSQVIRLDPNGTNVIRGGGAGKYAEIPTFTSIELTCITSGYWEITGLNGTVTYEP